MGCHPVLLYKAANGQLDMPAPKTIRIGRLLRVRDCDFQSFLDGLSSIKGPAKACDQDSAEPRLQPVKKRLGRPTKAAQLARREAASRAVAYRPSHHGCSWCAVLHSAKCKEPQAEGFAFWPRGRSRQVVSDRRRRAGMLRGRPGSVNSMASQPQKTLL